MEEFHCDLKHISKREVGFQIEETRNPDEKAFLIYAQEKLEQWSSDCYASDGETLRKHQMPFDELWFND